MVRSHLLSSETFSAARVLAGADSSSLQRGRTYFYQGRARVEQVRRNEAHLWVRGSRPSPYKIVVELTDGSVSVSCNCPYANNQPKLICRHKVAAALALQDYLRRNPPVTWETHLKKALDENGFRRAPVQKQALLFSLQKRSTVWNIYLYSLPAGQFPEFTPEEIRDPETLAREIQERGLSPEAKEVRAPFDAKRFVNATPESLIAAQLAFMAQQYYYYYYYDRSSSLSNLLPLLSQSALFRGTEIDPLSSPVRLTLSKATPELVLERSAEGLRLQARMSLDGKTLRPGEGDIEIISDDPLWVLSDSTLFPVEDPGNVFRHFVEHPEMEIPQEEEGPFLEQFFLPLAERIRVTGEEITWEDVAAEPTPRLYLSEVEGEMKANYRIGYGDYEVPYDRTLPERSIQRVPDSMQMMRIHRKPEAEEEAWRNLSNFGLKRGQEPGEFLLRAKVDPVDFLFKQVPRLAEAGFEVNGEEALTSARVNRNRPTISFNVSSGIDWFDVQGVVNFGEIEVSLKEIRKALRRKERYVKLADGSIGEIPQDWLEQYRYLFALGEETDDGLRLHQHHLTLIDQLLGESDRVRMDEEFQRRRQRLQEFSEIKPQALPAQLKGELRPYQKAGYDWLHFLHEFEFGGCLADDMGIGKTIQALAFLQSLKEQGKAQKANLIVMPRSLLFNWQREAERFTPDLRVYVHADQSREKELETFDRYDLVLTTYGIMLRDIELLRQYPFHYAILDESQAIKNPLALTSKAARLLQPDHRLVLTGTPVENSTMELWSQFAFLNPGLLGNLEFFKNEFGNAIEKRQDEDAALFLRKMVYPFILRRTKGQVAPELPPRSERILYTEMDGPQQKLYARTRDYYRAMLLGMIDKEGINDVRMKILEGLLRLRQICNHPRLVEANFKGESVKMEALLETLETLRAEGHKALVFSQFVQMLRIVRAELDRRKIPYVYLDGQTKDRQSRVDTFQNNDEIPFFLISLKAGGVGLNLTAADYVIHIDPWWNPAVEMQATDRTHRIGQDKPVFVYKLIVRETVEEKILQLQERKRDLVNQLITTETSFFKSLTRDDVKMLFE